MYEKFGDAKIAETFNIDLRLTCIYKVKAIKLILRNAVWSNMGSKRNKLIAFLLVLLVFL